AAPPGGRRQSAGPRTPGSHECDRQPPYDASADSMTTTTDPGSSAATQPSERRGRSVATGAPRVGGRGRWAGGGTLRRVQVERVRADRDPLHPLTILAVERAHADLTGHGHPAFTLADLLADSLRVLAPQGHVNPQ